MLNLNAAERTQIVLAILLLLTTLGGGAIGAAMEEPPSNTLDVPTRLQDPNTVFCGPTSLGMAFDYLHQQSNNQTTQPPSNQELVRYMKENHLLFDFGTGVEELAYTARQQGYTGSFYFGDWTMEQLKQQLADGRPVLAPIKQQNYAQPVGHFLTVTGFSDDGNFVIANDPLKGKVEIPVEQFNQDWQANGARGVVVAQAPIPTIPESAAPLFAGVGAAIALASLAALGMARKGLGTGRTDEGESSWADYNWYQPTQTVQDTWTWHDDYSYNPDSGFTNSPQVNASPSPVEQQVQTGGAGSGDSGGSSDDQNNNNNSNNNTDNSPAPSSQPARTSSRYEREEARQEQVARQQEIKTEEDARKKAERDAMSALERYMARHDEALDQQDRTVTNDDYAATLKRLQETEEQLKSQEQIKDSSILLSAHSIGYANTSDAQTSNLGKAEALLERYKNIMREVTRYEDNNPRYAKKEKMVAVEIGNLVKEIAQGNSQAALKFLTDAATINGEGLTAFLPKALQFSPDQVRAYITASFIEGKEVGNSAPLFIYQTMLNRELNRNVKPATLALSQYGGSLDVVKDLPEMFTSVKDKSGKTLLKVITEDENAKVVLERLKGQPGGIEALMTKDMYLKYMQAKADLNNKDEWSVLNESGAITLIFNPTNPALQDQAKALKQKAKEFMNGVELDKSLEAQQGLSAYGLLYATGQAAVTGSSESKDIGLTLKSTDYPNKPSDAEVRQMVDAWAGVPNLKFTVNPSPTSTGWQVTVKGGTPALFNQSYADAVLLKAGYTLDNPALFFANDPAKQQLADNLAKGYKYGNITENNVGNSATAKINGVSAYQAELQQWRDGAKDKNEYAEAQRAIDSLILIKGPGVSLITNAENPNLFFK